MATPDSPILEIENLNITFPGVHAVRGVSLSIRKGETVALVGESGSGKSMTALSATQLQPDTAEVSGSVRYQGEEMIGASPQGLRRIRGNEISMIFQEPMTSLNPLHTIERQIMEGLRLHAGLTGAKARARTLELLNEVGVRDAESRLKAYPHQLSGGQRQRVMIAMALANGPELLIADEPTTALDVTVQAQILSLLKELQARTGMALLIVSHDFAVVRRMADRICVMKDGEIVETGPSETVLENPQHPYTQRLLASEPSGSPAPPASDAKEIVSVDKLRIWFPIKRGLLKRTIGHVKAVNEASFSIRAGETLGVVGESGSGKTTLAQAVLRLISSQGRIVFLGKEISGLRQREIRPLREEMQVVFQDPYGSLSPRMSVAEIISEGLLIHRRHLNRAERREVAAHALEEVGVDPAFMDRYPHEFSGGQRQRIAIARAMALQPSLVALDEPTSALDMSVQAQMVDLLRGLQEKHGLAYLFISHDLKVVRAMAHKVMVMRTGDVVESGPVEAVMENPQTDYARALMAAAFEVKVA